MRSVNLGSAILAGLVGTVAMTVLMYAAPLMGLPPMDLLQALGGVFPLDVSPYLAGGLMHLGIGMTLALLYAVIFDRILPGPAWARGALFSLLPWLFAITLMGPAMAWLQTAVSPPAEARSMVNPCAASKPTNACAVRPTIQAVNPCAVQPRVTNPCAAVAPRPANPCGATAAGAQTSSPWLLRMMSLMAHLVYGAIIGTLYRRRKELTTP
jgi:hypothetical protein